MSCGNRISARKQGDVVPEPNEFFRQVGYDSLSSSIQFRRNALPQGRNLGNSHWTLPFIIGLLTEPQGENFLTWSDISFDFLSRNQHAFSLCVFVDAKIDIPSEHISDEILITFDGQQITPDRNLRSHLGLSEGIRHDDD